MIMANSDPTMGFIYLGIIFCLYFIPSFVAFSGKKKNAGAICCLNLFLGWTFIGWVVALVWAFMKD